MNASSSDANNWPDDLLGRKHSARFLYKALIQRFRVYHTKPGTGALCLALDAEWGAGKTFFIERWSRDIEDEGHAVFRFDAWANDLSDEPLVGFLSSLQEQIKPWLDRRAPLPKVKAALTKRVNGLVKQAGRAAFPVAGVVLGAVAKRYVGDAIEEVAELLGKQPRQLDADDQTSKGEKLDVTAGKAVDKFFQAKLKDHADRQQAIRLLKEKLEELVDFLDDEKIVNCPMFIFIDELDRCRPDYAIKLLESVKHLFNARGVCFVISTNLRQLSSAVRAVYGAEFDGPRYLKKFFSFEYVLPAPASLPFARALVKESAIEKMVVEQRQCVEIGTVNKSSTPQSIEGDLAESFAWLVDAMGLDLRSQRQVFQSAEMALAAWEGTDVAVLLYVFFLAAVLHLDRQDFESMFDSNGISNGTMPQRIKIADAPFSYVRRDDQMRPTTATKELRELLKQYHQIASQSAGDAIKAVNRGNGDFPADVLQRAVMTTWTWKGKSYVPLAKTGMLVKAAGYITS